MCCGPSLLANAVHQKKDQTGLEREDLGVLVLAPGDHHFFFLMCSQRPNDVFWDLLSRYVNHPCLWNTIL